MGKELAAASVAALDLIQHQHRVMGGAGLPQGVHEVVGRQLDAAHALNPFDDDGTHVPLRQFAAHGLDVVQRQVGDMSVGIDGRNDFRIVRGLHCQ